ncbi:hypothetical protein [Hyphococcus sp.]|uniref:hypothetical protein n=1 Tax=Hyphococcus sp. TaxID=2038636 RepID=UPI003CCBEFB8
MLPIIRRARKMIPAAALATGLMFSGAASAAHLDFEGYFQFTPLNESGVSGDGTITYDADNMLLNVNIIAEGLTPNQTHAQHIHGRFDDDGNPIDSVNPTLALDGNGGPVDGVISVPEGANAYGPIILGLTDSGGMFPTVGDDGVLNFSQTYDLSDSSLLADGFEVADLFDLFLREIVLHGGIVPGSIADDAGEFRPSLPVASAEIGEVPIPGAALLFLTGGLAGAWRFGKKKLRVQNAS